MMDTTTAGALPARLTRAQAEFEQWRDGRTTRAIPDRLWSLAVKAAAEYGVSATSRALRLDYYSLQRRMEGPGMTASTSSTFVDLLPSKDRSSEGTAEFEDPSGARIKIAWRGGAPDLAALTRSFLGGTP